MKPLSRETQTLIHSLYSANKPWYKRILLSNTHFEEVLDNIVVSEEAIAIVQLAPLFLSINTLRQELLAKAIKRLLIHLSQRDFVHLDKRIRGSYYSALRIEPEYLHQINHHFEDSWVFLALSSMAVSGYTREKSILLLKSTVREELLPFLLLRANDWVDEVRQAAFQGLQAYLTADHAELLVSNLYLFSRLEEGRAHDDGDVKKICFKVLQSDSCRPILKRALNHKDRLVRRMCFQLYLESPIDNVLDILKNGIHDEDVLIRLYSSRKLRTLPKDDAVLELSKNMLLDSFMPVRRIALAILKSYPYERYRELIHETICNRSISLRKTCRNLIEEHENVEPQYFIEHYKSKLLSHDTLYLEGALLGLSELGDESHCALVEPFLEHQCARIRRTSIRVLYHLNAKAYRDTFYHLLIHDQGSVSKEAALALIHAKAFIDPEDILMQYHAAGTKEKKLLLLWLIHHSLHKWDRLRILLHAASCPDEVVFSRCSLYLETWIQQFNKGNTNSTIENRARARAALNEVSPVLDTALVERLSFYLPEN